MRHAHRIEALVLRSTLQYTRFVALERFNHLPAARREEILRIAADAFSTRGFDGTSYNELLTRLGMGKSQAYYYFADKADLFTTALAAVYEDFYAEAARLPEPCSAEGFWDYVRALHLLGFRYQRSHPLAARLTKAMVDAAARLQYTEGALQAAAGTERSYTQWLTLGQSLGAVRDDLPFDFLLRLCAQTSALVDGWFAERATSTTCQELETLADTFTDLSRRMLEPSK